MEECGLGWEMRSWEIGIGKKRKRLCRICGGETETRNIYAEIGWKEGDAGRRWDG